MLASAPQPGNEVRLAWPGGRGERARLLSIGKSGGAGEVFAVEGRPELVAKIYHASIAPEARARYARKIRWMLDRAPPLAPIATDAGRVVQLAWPVAEARRGGEFAGFLMEKIDFERTMELDYLLTRRQAEGEGFEVDYGKLMTICRNLASLVGGLHAQRIAVVDLKPINLKVYKAELLVSILDCDGFHIQSGSFVSEAPQITPEYLAPEFQGRLVSDPREQDRFALATIVFRLLNFGIHPYAGAAAGRKGYPTELAARVAENLYPYGAAPLRGVRPAPASVHACLPDEARALFDAAFGAGVRTRPSAAAWAGLLERYASRGSEEMIRCLQGHLQFAGKPCPTCLRAAVIEGHVQRQRRFATRLQAAPARALRYVRRTIQGTQVSPFQAALAQGQLNAVQLAPVTLSLRNVLAIEILWTLGLAITYWWLK